MLRLTIVIVFFLASGVTAYAQNDLQDVIYLNNDTTVRGVIVENVPNEYVRLQTPLGNTFTYKWDQIAKITREPRLIDYQRKNPSTSTTMSCLFPGMGQFYNEHYGKGIAFALANVVGFALLFAGIEDNVEDDLGSLFQSEVFLRDAGNDDELAAVGFVILIGSWSLSMLDAYNQAETINYRYLNKRRSSMAQVQPITTRSAIGAKVSLEF